MTEAEIRADEKKKIARWLNGLERNLYRVIEITRDPEEKATMIARRGLYEGVAEDITSGAADRATYP